MSHMDEIKEEYRFHDVCHMRKTLIDWTKTEMAHGKECVGTAELGAAVDMIKDLYEAEKSCWEACYYKSVVDAMHAQDEDDSHEWRRGYNPDMGPHSNAMAMKDHMEHKSAYEHYKHSRDMNNKPAMDEHAKHYMSEFTDNFVDIWKDADPEMRKHMRATIDKIEKMTV